MSSSDSSTPELEQPLLANEADYDGFSGAGIWSRLTFGWLSPLFEKGRAERLELSHVPRVPRSESAKASFGLLQESLRKRKAESSSFQRAVVHSVRRCLALNAIFAGTQKICIPLNRHFSSTSFKSNAELLLLQGSTRSFPTSALSSSPASWTSSPTKIPAVYTTTEATSLLASSSPPRRWNP